MNPNVARAVTLGLSPAGIAAARAAAKKTWTAFPHNGCAAFLSALLREAGLDGLPEILGAGALAHRLEQRGWARLPRTQARVGDVAVTFDEGGNPGADHIFLILETTADPDVVRIIDNQDTKPHFRHLSGHGKTPTEYVLRAPEK